MTGRALLAVLLSLLARRAWSMDPALYLTSDGPAIPGVRAPTVKLEAQHAEYADIRIYRLRDPKAYVAALSDPHRPVTDNTPRRKNAVDLLWNAYRRTADRMYTGFRVAIAPPARKGSKAVLDEARQRLEAGLAKHGTEQPMLPPLAGFELVKAWREDLGATGQWVYRDLPIGEREPGAYLVEAIWKKEAAHAVVVVGNLALLTKQGPGQLVAYAADATTGEPVAGAAVTIYDTQRRDQPILAGRTGTDGTFRAAVPKGASSHLLAFAEAQEGFAVHDPVYHPSQVRERRAYIFTERPVYRPGQTVSWKAWLRSPEGENRWQAAPSHAADLQVLDPKGSVLESGKVKLAGGAAHGELALPPEAAMGVYTLALELDGVRYGGEFKVKEYIKPESAIAFETDRPAYAAGDTVQVTGTAAYFFGAPVSGASYEIDVYRTRFFVPRWADAEAGFFYSEAEARLTERRKITEARGKLDGRGRFSLQFPTERGHADWTYVVEARVTDESKRVTTGELELTVTRGAFHVDVRTARVVHRPGAQVKIELRARDYGDRAVQARLHVTVAAEKPRADGQTESQRFLEKDVELGPDGQGAVAFSAPGPGYYQIRAAATDARGVEIVGEGFVFATSEGGDLPFAPGQLTLVPDRASYQPGDVAEVLLLAPFAQSSALVTVEGHEILEARVEGVSGYSRVLRVKIDERHAPNCYVGVAAVSGGELYRVDRALVVPPRDRLLRVGITTDRARYAPGDRVKAEVRVEDAAGKPVEGAEVALAVVDEAIYEISPELVTPLPEFFYPKRRQNVRTGSSLAYKFYGYSREPKLRKKADAAPSWARAFGAIKDLDDPRARRRNKDTAHWAPALRTGADGVARTSFDLPGNLTRWRLSAWALTPDTRVGSARASFVSKKDLLVRLSAPRFLRDGDVTSAHVIAHNYTDRPAALTLTLGDAPGQTRQAAPGARVAASFPIKIAPRALASGLQTLTARVTEDRREDALEIPMPVQPRGFEDVETESFFLGGAADAERDVTLTIPEDAVQGTARLQVRAGVGYTQALIRALEYVAGYPYGCTEQTMSRFLPAVVAAHALRSLGIHSAYLETEAPKFVRAGLAHLRHLQHEDGGWGWWTDDPSDARMTALVVQGLALARRAGVDVDPELVGAGLRRLGAFAGDARLDDLARAMVLYGLALGGSPNTALAKRVLERRPGLYARGLLALALSEIGERDAAAQAAAPLGGQGFDPVWLRQRQVAWSDDRVETAATAVRAILRTTPTAELVDPLVQHLLTVRQDGHWESTRDTTAAALALVDFLEQRKASYPETKVTARLPDGQEESRTIRAEDLGKPDLLVMEEPFARTGEVTFKLRKTGAATVLASAVLSYRRTRGESERGSKLTVTRRVLTRDGAPRTGPLAQGQEVLIALSVHANEAVEHLMVEDPLPAGLEPIERDAGAQAPIELHPEGVHRELRLDRAVFFKRAVKRGETLELGYLARAVFVGKFEQPPARAMLMYHPDVGGRSRADHIEIEPR